MIQSLPASSSANQSQVPSWTRRLPDGAVSVSELGGNWVLRASRPLQSRFEELLDRRKLGSLDKDESEEYDALCALDDALSWLNRLARHERKR